MGGIQLLVVSKYQLSGEALAAWLCEDTNFHALYRPAFNSEDLPEGFSPQVIILNCGESDPSCAAIGLLIRQRPDSKLIAIARSPQQSRQIEWLKCGILGIIDEAEESALQDLKQAIRVVLEGEVWAPRRLLSEMLSIPAGHSGNDHPSLTRRETELMRLVGKGLRNSTIAARLKISEKTVKGHLTSIYRKLGVENRTQAALQIGNFEPSGR